MPLDPKLTKYSTASPVLVNIDFFDLAAGVGIKTFYAADVNSDAELTVGEYILTTNQIYSSVGYTNTAGAGDYDFDVVLTRNLRIGGECVINIPVKLSNESGGSATGTTTITATVRHYDGSTETDLGSESTLVSLSMNTSVSRVATIATIRLNITEKSFRKGDTLRLTIAHTDGDAGSEGIAIGHDPKGRLTVFGGVGAGGGVEWTTTTLTMHLPIIIDQ